MHNYQLDMLCSSAVAVLATSRKALASQSARELQEARLELIALLSRDQSTFRR